MSAPAAAPVLSILPPGQPPAPAADSVMQAHQRQARIRSVAMRTGVSAALFTVTCVAASPYLRGWAGTAFILSWMTFALCGLCVVVVATASRTGEDLRAILNGVVAMAIAISLVEPVGRVGMEAFASSHAVELEAIAARRAATLSRTDAANLADERLEFAASADGEALKRLGLRSEPAEGGLIFRTASPFAPDLFYADPSLHPRDECADARMTPVGGRWYLYECMGRRPSD